MQNRPKLFLPMPNCFEVFGFDFLVDSAWKVWLLEVRELHGCGAWAWGVELPLGFVAVVVRESCGLTARVAAQVNECPALEGVADPVRCSCLVDLCVCVLVSMTYHAVCVTTERLLCVMCLGVTLTWCVQQALCERIVKDVVDTAVAPLLQPPATKTVPPTQTNRLVPTRLELVWETGPWEAAVKGTPKDAATTPSRPAPVSVGVTSDDTTSEEAHEESKDDMKSGACMGSDGASEMRAGAGANASDADKKRRQRRPFLAASSTFRDEHLPRAWATLHARHT